MRIVDVGQQGGQPPVPTRHQSFRAGRGEQSFRHASVYSRNASVYSRAGDDAWTTSRSAAESSRSTTRRSFRSGSVRRSRVSPRTDRRGFGEEVLGYPVSIQEWQDPEREAADEELAPASPTSPGMPTERDSVRSCPHTPRPTPATISPPPKKNKERHNAESEREVTMTDRPEKHCTYRRAHCT